MGRFNGILFHKSGPANKQHSNRSSSYRLFSSAYLLHGVKAFASLDRTKVASLPTFGPLKSPETGFVFSHI